MFSSGLGCTVGFRGVGLREKDVGYIYIYIHIYIYIQYIYIYICIHIYNV